MSTIVSFEEVRERATFVENRTHLTDTKGRFVKVADYRDGGIFWAGFSGVSQWERHPVGDEIVQIVDGSVTLTLRSEHGDEVHELSAGMLAIVPQGVWHQFRSPHGVTVLTTTPQPPEHITDEAPTLR